MTLRLYTSTAAYAELLAAEDKPRANAQEVKVPRAALKALLMDHPRLIAAARDHVDTDNPLPLQSA